MSTTTMTATTLAPSIIPPKSKSAPMLASTSTATPSTTAPTLRSLYPRAARALLQRDASLAHSLISSAFSLLNPPQYLALDDLDSHRRKWDILRITLETTVYVSPPKSSDPEELPSPLRSNILMSGPSLIATLHTRSVRLFTPTLTGHKPKSAYLPAQILITLVLSSLKLECPDVGRSMIEDWLAQREMVEHVRNDVDGYEKVLDLFCLHVLPRLHDWEYAKDFLEYESILPSHSRMHLLSSLEELRRREIEAARHIPSPPALPSTSSSSSAPSPGRTPSPAPSMSSASSLDSLDTTSTRTVVPRTRTPRPKQGFSSLSNLAESAAPSVLAEPMASLRENGAANGHALQKSPRSSSGASSASAARSQHTDAISIPSHVVASQIPDVLSIVKSYLRPHFTTSKLVFAFLFVVVPLFSFVLRVRRKRLLSRRLAGPGSGAVSPLRPSLPPSGTVASVVDVRRRLGISTGRPSLLGSAWREMTRAVSDAVRMAGGGLV